MEHPTLPYGVMIQEGTRDWGLCGQTLDVVEDSLEIRVMGHGVLDMLSDLGFYHDLEHRVQL